MSVRRPSNTCLFVAMGCGASSDVEEPPTPEPPTIRQNDHIINRLCLYDISEQEAKELVENSSERALKLYLEFLEASYPGDIPPRRSRLGEMVDDPWLTGDPLRRNNFRRNMELVQAREERDHLRLRLSPMTGIGGRNQTMDDITHQMDEMMRISPMPRAAMLPFGSNGATPDTFEDDLQRAMDESMCVATPSTDCSLPDEPEDGNGTCVICISATVQVCLLNARDQLACTHICMCKSCADKLTDSARKCPLCREPFAKVKKLNIELPTEDLSDVSVPEKRPPTRV